MADNNLLKVSDFGLSSLVKRDQETLLHTTCGSINYIAPEILRNVGYEGHKADIWSMGVILYNMLSKTLPFDDESIPKLIDKIVLVQYAFPKGFSSKVKDFICKILVSNPSKRMTLQEMKEHEWLKDESIPKQELADEIESKRKGSLVMPNKMNAVELFALLFGNVMQRMFQTNSNTKYSYYNLNLTIRKPIDYICKQFKQIILDNKGVPEFDYESSIVS